MIHLIHLPANIAQQVELRTREHDWEIDSGERFRAMMALLCQDYACN